MRQIVALIMTAIVFLQFSNAACAGIGRDEQCGNEESNGEHGPTLLSCLLASQMTRSAKLPEVFESAKPLISQPSSSKKKLLQVFDSRKPLILQHSSSKGRRIATGVAGGILLAAGVSLAASALEDNSKGRVASGIALLGGGIVLLAWGW